MNERMLTNTMLVIGVVITFLIINFCFRRHSRLLLWAEGLIAIVGTLLGIGLGWIKLFLPDGYPNFPVVTAVTILFAAGVAFILAAEEMHKKLKTKQSQEEITNVSSNEEAFCDNNEIQPLPLKGKLDTPLARIIFKKALESDLMTIENVNEFRQCYHWNGTKVLLAYMCGRIYCGDTGMPIPDSKDVVWNGGKGVFPSNDLDRLFNEKDLGQQRSNRLDNKVPKDFEKVDQLFS